MSSLSRELVFLILQFLDEEKFKETVHKWVPAPPLSPAGPWAIFVFFSRLVGGWLGSQAPRDLLRRVMIFFSISAIFTK
jgi:hypothetical protein